MDEQPKRSSDSINEGNGRSLYEKGDVVGYDTQNLWEVHDLKLFFPVKTDYGKRRCVFSEGSSLVEIPI